VTALEEQLRAGLRAEAEIITPDSIGDLRLPGHPERPPGTLRRGGPRRWPAWVKPLAAAAAVAAVVGGTFAVAGSIPGVPSGGHARALFTQPPAYYAYTVQGDIYNYSAQGTQYSASVPGRYLKVRATGTGNLLASVSPPKPYNDFSLVTADASGGVFVLGAARFWQASASSRLGARNPLTPLRFELLRITRAGHTQVSGLSLPGVVTPAQQPSIALSPDGSRLAVAVGGGPLPAVVRVITLATGRQQEWVWQRVPWTPQVSSNGAWTANGRTLAVREWFYPRAAVRSVINTFKPPSTAQVHLLDTVAAARSPGADRLVALHPLAGQSLSAQPFITPDGTSLISAEMAPWAAGGAATSGALVLYSASTGARIRTVARWGWSLSSLPGHAGSPRQTVAWSSGTGSQLIVLQPQHDLNVLGVLAGRAFTTASALLPRRPSGYAELQYALRAGSQLAW
jgi:hypothetical protein